jgi:hypothetical protein
MHEFLMAQQRKREQYWLAKYGKLLQPPAAAQAVGKPNHNPSSLFRCAVRSQASNSSGSSSMQATC